MTPYQGLQKHKINGEVKHSAPVIQKRENELTFPAAIQLNSQARYIKIVGLWMKTDEAGINVRLEGVYNDSVSVSVPSIDLK